MESERERKLGKGWEGRIALNSDIGHEPCLDRKDWSLLDILTRIGNINHGPVGNTSHGWIDRIGLSWTFELGLETLTMAPLETRATVG